MKKSQFIKILSDFEVVETPMTWNDARKYCQVINRDLASIQNEVEHDKLMAAIKSGSWSWWIGLTDEEEEGKWLWSDGREVTFTSWHSGYPNWGTRGNCAHLYVYSKKWFDHPCYYQNSFVCRITSGW